MRDIQPFLAQLKQWLLGESAIEGALLVGSYARGTAHTESDVDLVFITSTPQHYLDNEQWIHTFGKVTRIEHEDWGKLQSKRVFYEDGTEVEFGITTPDWAEIYPLDAGTRRVIMDGVHILMDRQGRLAVLIDFVKQS